jgi:outer membrane biosynthesis protein TonB
MKTIAQRVWREPAVCIGLLTSVILLVLQLIGDNKFTADTIIAIVAPFASALGIRQLVTPTAKPTEGSSAMQETPQPTPDPQPEPQPEPDPQPSPTGDPSDPADVAGSDVDPNYVAEQDDPTHDD